MSETPLSTLYAQCRVACAVRWPAQAERLVFGEGLADQPPIMLIGEAPGEQEAVQGRPFVGKAGKNLSAFLETLGCPREGLYISNVVKLRPARISAAGRTVNRPPSREEIAFFMPWLYREIATVKPKLLVTLGNVALHAFVPSYLTIGDCHGRLQSVDVRGGHEVLPLPLFALYHPASILYNRALAAVYQADLAALALLLPPNGNRNDT